MIPEEIKKKIEEKSLDQDSFRDEETFMDGAEFGYSLALAEIARLKDDVKELAEWLAIAVGVMNECQPSYNHPDPGAIDDCKTEIYGIIQKHKL